MRTIQIILAFAAMLAVTACCEPSVDINKSIDLYFSNNFESLRGWSKMASVKKEMLIRVNIFLKPTAPVLTAILLIMLLAKFLKNL